MPHSLTIPVNESQVISAIYSTSNANHLEPMTTSTDNERFERGLVIMVHGFPGTREGPEGVFTDLKAALNKRDFDTLLFDFRGCGESDGEMYDLNFASVRDDMKAVLEWGRAAGYSRFFLIGEGLGALFSLLNRPAEDVRGLVYLWPVFDPRPTYLKTVFDLADSFDKVKHPYIADKTDRYGWPFLADLKAVRAPLIIKGIDRPLLVQHGQKDKLISSVQLELLRRYAQNAKRIEVTTYENGGHGLSNKMERKTLIHHTVQFLSRFQ